MNSNSFDPSILNFDKLNGLIPAVVQDVATREVLMVGFMNKAALEKTLADQRVTFWSRTKQRLWQKGEESGNFLKVRDIKVDCDQDTILVLAEPMGPTCHTGERTCFGENSRGIGFLGALFDLIQWRKQERPKGSYTTSLFEKGLPEILAKVEEESEEVCRAGREETQERLAEETADLLYHTWVLLAEKKVSLEEVVAVLEKRAEKKIVI